MNRRILYTQFTNPAGYPPLVHSAHLLAQAGWQVTCLGIAYPETAPLRMPAHPNLVFKLLPTGASGKGSVSLFLRYALWVWETMVRLRPDWIYASDLLVTPLALTLSYLPFLRVLYHEHDTPVAPQGFARRCLWTRARLAHRAALSVLPNAARRNLFAREFGTSVKTIAVWNCPVRAEVAPPSPKSGRERFRLLYHGSIVPSRLPPTVIDALAQLPEHVQLRVVGYETLGHTGYINSLRERADALHVAHRIEWLGAVPTRTELLALARECEIGLALMPMHSDDVNEQTMAGASNKPFDYMACSLGMLVSDLPDWRALFVETNFARVCDPGDPPSIANAVGWYLEHPAERAQQAERARAKILDDWNYETQFAPVFQQIVTETA